MKLILVGTAYPMRGGIAHYTAQLYNELINRGHDVSVLSFKRQYPSFLFPGKTQKDEGEELISVHSTPILDSIGPVSWLRAFFWIKEKRPNTVIFQYWMPFFAPCYAFIAFLIKRLSKAKTLYICHNIMPHEKKIGDKFLTRMGLKYIDRFIVQSGTVKNDLLFLKPNAVYRLTPHPVYDIFPKPISKHEAKKNLNISENHVILFFGYIREYKGLKYLIDAMPSILSKIKVKLLVCGEFYEGREDIYQKIEDYKIKDSVNIYDCFIPNQDVNKYFCASDIIVLPYVSATQSGIVQIAYHYEKPVIVTNTGGLPEVVMHEKTGFVIPVKDSNAIANTVTGFFKEQSSDRFKEAIHEEKKKYSWGKLAETIEILSFTG